MPRGLPKVTGFDEIMLRRRREFYSVGAVILIGAVGHIMWWFIGEIPEEDHPKYFVANVAFYLSLIELLGFALMGLLLWSVWRDDQKMSILISILWLLLYLILLSFFLGISHHPLGLTIWMLALLLVGSV